jgi:hypothetical protein
MVQVEPHLDPRRRLDAVLKIKTVRRVYKLGLEVKKTFFDRTLTNAIITQHHELEKKHRIPLLVVARYIPRPTGERLAEEGVNFVDRVGNIHLNLGPEYYILILGRKEREPEPVVRRPGPATVQLYFVLLAEPQAAGWPIRKLAKTAGVGKTVGAMVRHRLLQAGILRQVRTGAYQWVNREKVEEDFLRGYTQMLRRRILLGTFRAQEPDPQMFVRRFAMIAKREQLPWALAGGPAAYALEKFYHGDQIPIFVNQPTRELQQELKLVPDTRGSVVFLRIFGNLVLWKTAGELNIAHPWLIYAELLNQGEPRALQAAEEIRENYLLR